MTQYEYMIRYRVCVDENNKRQYRIVFPIVTFKLIIIYNTSNREVCTYAKCV